LYRADPDYNNSIEPWYDLAFINWGGNHGCIPGKLLIYIDLSTIFQSSFTMNDVTVNQAGKYAIVHSLASLDDVKEYEISLLMEYGELQVDQRKQPKIFLCSVDNQIKEPCCAVPYDPEKTIISAKQWLFLKTRRSWYSILLDHLEGYLVSERMVEELPRKKKRSAQRNAQLKKYNA
jgi:hypothetical protein